MGQEIGYSAAVDHPALGSLTWELWEYPVGAENMRETDVNGHELLENIDFGLQDLADDDEPEDEPPPLAIRLAQLPRQLDEMDSALAQLRVRSSMIGHNQAPAEFRLDVDPAQIDAARDSITDIRQELSKPDPEVEANTVVLEKAEGRLRQLASTIGSWLKSGAQALAKGGIAWIGGALTMEVFSKNAALQNLLVTVADTLSAWIQFIASL